MPVLTDKNAIRKAAVLIRSLDGEAAAAVLQRLSAEEARALRDAVRELGEVGEAERRAVAEELTGPPPATAASERGGVELAIGQPPAPAIDSLLPRPQEMPLHSATRHGVTPQAPAEGSTQASAEDEQAGTPTDWLADADPQALVTFLRHEQPQTIATVLSCLPPGRAAGLLAALPEGQRPLVLDRLADLGDADPETLEVITSGLREWITQRQKQRALRTRRLGSIEAILAASDDSQRADLLGAVENRPWRQELSPAVGHLSGGGARNASVAETEVAPPSSQGATTENTENREVEQTASAPSPPPKEPPPAEEPRLLVSFADVERFPTAALAQVMRYTPAEHLLLALAGGSDGLTRKITAALPRRQATELRRRVTRIGPTRLQDIDRAQHAVAQVASELLRRGWVSLTPSIN